MYKVVKKVCLNPSVTMMDIEAPFVAAKAEPGADGRTEAGKGLKGRKLSRPVYHTHTGMPGRGGMRQVDDVVISSHF